jgi:hypothetical protein
MQKRLCSNYVRKETYNFSILIVLITTGNMLNTWLFVAQDLESASESMKWFIKLS